jgi:hypothetical protein
MHFFVNFPRNCKVKELNSVDDNDSSFEIFVWIISTPPKVCMIATCMICEILNAKMHSCLMSFSSVVQQ